MSNLRENQLKALLRGLQVPNVESWLKRPPAGLNELGMCIAEKASGGHPEIIDASKRLAPYMLIEVDETQTEA